MVQGEWHDQLIVFSACHHIVDVHSLINYLSVKLTLFNFCFMIQYVTNNKTSFFIVLFSLSHFINAQVVNVSGTITDENNEGMPGVTIKEVNGESATTTNLEGYYKISVASDTSKLEYSFVGYEKQFVIAKINPAATKHRFGGRFLC